jgi:hypothetical protein
MPKTRINCPNCRQPIVADVEQLFDVAADPAVKQKFLSGAINQIQCPNCGYTGNLATPVVYHDPDKELLLTFVPGELGLPRNEQERLVGSLINQVVNKLPPEKRKAYLLRPQSSLTLQNLVEQVLQAEGITREMIQGQQQRLNLMQRLMSVSEDARAELVKQEDQLIDAQFFGMLNQLVEAAVVNGDQQSARQLANFQQSLLPITSFGRRLQEETKEIESAMASLRDLGSNLTRENLLDLVINASTDTRVRALVSLARPGMDYQFFQLLSDRIDRARGDGRTRLIKLRETLLELTREIDQQVEQRRKQARDHIDQILQAPNVKEAISQNLHLVDEFFMGELNAALQSARQEGDLSKIGKLNEAIQVIQQESEPPAEVAFIEDLVEAPDDNTRRQIIEANRDKITQELIDALTGIVGQVEAAEDKELSERVKSVYKLVLRYSMENQLRG